MLDQPDRDDRCDFLVEPDAQEIGVCGGIAQRVMLHRLDDCRGVERGVILNFKLNEGVFAASCMMDKRLERAQIHRKRHRLPIAAIQYAGQRTRRAHFPRLSLALRLARGYLESLQFHVSLPPVDQVIILDE